MAIQTKITQPGNAQTTTLDGQIRLDEGSGRLIVTNAAGIEMVIVSQDGLLLSDGTDRRLILGVFPDNTIGLVVSKPGEDVVDAFS